MRKVELTTLLPLGLRRVNTVIDLMLIFNFSCSCLFGTLNSDLVTCSYSAFLYYGNGTDMTTINISTTQPPSNILIDIGMVNITAITHHHPTKRIFYAGFKSVGASVIKELKLNGNIHRELLDSKYNGLKCCAFLNGKFKSFGMSKKKDIGHDANAMDTNFCICMYSYIRYVHLYILHIHTFLHLYIRTFVYFVHLYISIFYTFVYFVNLHKYILYIHL